MKKKVISVAIATAFAIGTGIASAQNIILENEYVKAGVNETTGTLGSGGNTNPGLQYDATGTGTFNSAYDYLTPGSPFEGFTVKLDGTMFRNNNAGNFTQITGSGWDGTPTSASAIWNGSVAGQFNLRNTYSLPAGQQYIGISTRIEMLTAATDLYFARYIDPDARAAAGDSSVTDNVRGYSGIPATNVIFSEALSSRYALGLYSSRPSGVNTGPSNSWSTDPSVYYSGGSYTVGQGDHTIGISFYSSGLSVGDIVTYDYAYIFGPNAFGAATTAITSYDPTATFTVTDVGSATSAASGAPTVTGTSTTNNVTTVEALDSSLPAITASVAHHDASRSGGVQSIARTTDTAVTTPWIRTISTTPVTTTSYSDGSTTTTTGSTATSTELFNVVSNSTTNDVFTGRADQAEQFDAINKGLYRILNGVTAANGVSDGKGRIAINANGVRTNQKDGFNANTAIYGVAYERDINPDLVLGFQVNKLSSKLSGPDTANASMSGMHGGVYLNYTQDDWISQNNIGYISAKNRYDRTIGPFSNSYSNDNNVAWATSRLYTPAVSNLRGIVGATVLKNGRPEKMESGSIQSAQLVAANKSTETIGEVGLNYTAEIDNNKIATEVVRTSNNMTQANLSLSRNDKNVNYQATLGKLWMGDSNSVYAGVNVRVNF